MDKLIILGKSDLFGSIDIHGAKNAALPIMVASLLSKQDLCLCGLPYLNDITTMKKLLSNFGLKIIPENPNSLVENILQLRSNPEMSKIMGNNGFNLVKKKYNRKVLAYQMIQTIDTI